MKLALESGRPPALKQAALQAGYTVDYHRVHLVALNFWPVKVMNPSHSLVRRQRCPTRDVLPVKI